MSRRITIAKLTDVPPGAATSVYVEDRDLAVFNVAGRLCALENTCSHAGGPLSDGEPDGHVVTCPWHGACFDVTTGQAVGPPATESVARYDVHIEGDDIQIDLP